MPCRAYACAEHRSSGACIGEGWPGARACQTACASYGRCLSRNARTPRAIATTSGCVMSPTPCLGVCRSSTLAEAGQCPRHCRAHHGHMDTNVNLRHTARDRVTLIDAQHMCPHTPSETTTARGDTVGKMCFILPMPPRPATSPMSWPAWRARPRAPSPVRRAASMVASRTRSATMGLASR